MKVVVDVLRILTPLAVVIVGGSSLLCSNNKRWRVESVIQGVNDGNVPSHVHINPNYELSFGFVHS